MRPKHAATALVALGAASACVLGTGFIHSHSTQATNAALTVGSWSVQSSSDFGTTWNSAVLARGTAMIPFRVDTARLRVQAAYLPLTLRTATGTTEGASITFGRGTLISGPPGVASAIKVRTVVSTTGSCSSSTVESGVIGLRPPAGLPSPIDAVPSEPPLLLPPGTATTPGAAKTLCTEFTVAPGDAAVDGLVTVAWPMTLSASGPAAG